MRKQIRLLSSVVVMAMVLAGCAAQQPATVNVNRTITTGIADAGTVAIQAEKLYEAGSIKQTTANRNLINGLGNAYNTARASWLVVLSAESAYNTAQSNQIAACLPGPNSPETCKDATATAARLQQQLTTAQVDLNAKVSAMASQTTAVQALTK